MVEIHNNTALCKACHSAVKPVAHTVHHRKNLANGNHLRIKFAIHLKCALGNLHNHLLVNLSISLFCLQSKLKGIAHRLLQHILFKLWQQSACAKDKSKRFLRLNALNNLSVYREGVLQCNNFILIDCHIIILLYYVNDCFLLHSSLFSYLILLPNLYIL